MTSEILKDFIDKDFKAGIAEGVWLISFWDYTCGSCKAMVPMLEGVALDFEGRAGFGRVNLTDAPETSEEMDLRFLPYTMIFKDGEKVSEIIGSKPEEQYVNAVEKALS